MDRLRTRHEPGDAYSVPMKPLAVKNWTRQTAVVTRGLVAADLWSRFIGLMGRRELPPGFGLLLKHESAIHSFFMRVPIDVVYLDSQGKVVKITPAMPPNRLGPLVRGVQDVLELPVGTVERTQTCVGDQLELTIL